MCPACRLYNEFDWMNVTLSNATIARMWLLQMGNAAERNGVNIQYCMPYPRHALQRCVATRLCPSLAPVHCCGCAGVA